MPRRRLVVVFGIVALGLAGPAFAVSLAAAHRSDSLTTNSLAAGKSVFKANCASCHTLKAAAAHGTVGPNLDTLKLTLAKIKYQVTNGGRFMPPFGASAGGSLSPAQVQDVSAFVYSAEHGSATASSSGTASGAKLVKVTAGKPSELKFTLSKKTVTLGSITFTVTNDGKLVHDFKVCTSPSTKATRNTCNGKATKKLAPHQSIKLTVVFKKKGTYEYLCTIPGHAAAGMKGVLKVA